MSARLREGLTPGRALLGIVLLAALTFYLVNVAHFAQQPLRIEENEWPRMARAIYENGRPFISAEESQRLRVDNTLGADEALRFLDEPFIGAWHPPLYQYLMALTIPVLGTDASFGLRGVGIAALLAACALMFLIAREVDRRRWPLIGTAGVALFLVHPYAIQSSTFLDIDTSIYGAVILLLLWLALRYVARPGWLGPKQLGLLVLAGTLVCWAKLTTVVVLAPALALYWILARGPRRGIPEMAVVVGGAAGLFFATYALWSWIVDIPFSYMFDVTFVEKRGMLGGAPEEREWVFRWQAAWFGPALFMLALAYGVDAVVSFVRTRRPRPLDLLWGCGVAVLLLYAWVTPNPTVYQGKYAAPALPLLILPVAWMCLRGVRATPPVLALATATAVAVVAALLMPDMTTDEYWFYADDLWRTAVVLGTALALVVAWRVVPRVAALSVGPLIVAAALFVAQSVHSFGANTSPLYPVTDTEDFNAVVASVNRALAPGTIAFVSKDIGFYVKPYAKVIEGHDAIYRGDERAARVLREDPRVTVFANDSFGPPLGPAIAAALEACFRGSESYGTAGIRTRTSRKC